MAQSKSTKTKKKVKKAVQKQVKKHSKAVAIIAVILIIAIVALLVYGYFKGWFDSILHPQKVEFVKTSVTLKEGETVDLLSEATGEITWTSSDESIAKVVDGKVQAIAPGKVTITATCGNAIASCTVTVVKPGVVSSDNLSVHFLELGKMENNQLVGSYKTGDCVYIKAGDVDILIDAGAENASSTVLTGYIDQFVTDNTLEYVIATHAHEDHIGAFYSEGGREGIFDHYKTEMIIDFAQTNKTSAGPKTVLGKYYAARNAEQATHYTAAQCFNEEDGAQRIYQITEDISMEILYNEYYFKKPSSGENDCSVCIMIHQGENHYMFTGDLESGAEKKMVQYYKNVNTPLPHCVLYKAGHHGSKTSTSNELMAAITPEYCCICTCCGSSEYTDVNANQFPTQDFVNRISPYTDRVYLTSLVTDFASKTIASMNGNIVFTCDNGEISMTFSNNDTKLKDTEWFQTNRTCPTYWQTGTTTPSKYHD